jgi:hypothetical protein
MNRQIHTNDKMGTPRKWTLQEYVDTLAHKYQEFDDAHLQMSDKEFDTLQKLLAAHKEKLNLILK